MRPQNLTTALCATLAAVLSLGACAETRPFVWARNAQSARMVPSEIPIRTGDKVLVLVAGQDALSGEHEVRADGRYLQPVAGSIAIAGITTAEAAKRISTRLSSVVQSPRVTVSVVAPRPPEVSVLGEVRQPGRFDVDPDDSVLDALARAGGISEFANHDAIYVVRKTERPSRIRFRYEDLTGGDPASIAFDLKDGDVIVVE